MKPVSVVSSSRSSAARIGLKGIAVVSLCLALIGCAKEEKPLITYTTGDPIVTLRVPVSDTVMWPGFRLGDDPEKYKEALTKLGADFHEHFVGSWGMQDTFIASRVRGRALGASDLPTFEYTVGSPSDNDAISWIQLEFTGLTDQEAHDLIGGFTTEIERTLGKPREETPVLARWRDAKSELSVNTVKYTNEPGTCVFLSLIRLDR